MATFRLELPEVFTEEEGKDFRQWVRRFEVAVDSMPSSSSSSVQKHTLLPSRLSGSAFTVWESLPESEKKDFGKVKTVLSEVFGRTTYLTNFRSCITARVRLPSEPIEVFSAAIATLVREAFPKYDDDAREGENFRRFMAGLDGVLRRKLYEHGVQTFKSAVSTAVRIEQAALLGQSETSQLQVAATSKADSYSILAQRLASLEEKMDLLVQKSQNSGASYRPSSPHRYESSYRPSSPHRYESSYRSSSPRRYESSYRPSSPRRYESSYRSSSPRRYESSYRSSSPRRYESSYRSSSPRRYESSSVRQPPTSPRGRQHDYFDDRSDRAYQPTSFRQPDEPMRQPPTPPRTQNRVHFDDRADQVYHQGNDL